MTTESLSYALDLDEDLLSHLPDPDAWVYLNGEGFEPVLIEDDEIREIFIWQRQHLRQHGKPATTTVLEDEFDLNLEAPEAAIGDLIERFRKRFARNQQREVVRDIVKLQNQEPDAVVPTLLRKGRELGAILTPKGEVYGTGDYDRAMVKYDEKVLRGPGASYGHPDLDEYFFGMHGLQFWIAPPKTLKSWQMVQATMANALDGKLSYLYSLELPAIETYMRLQHLLADVPWWKYLRNALSKQDRQLLKQAAEIIDDSGVYKIAKPPSGKRGVDELIYTARDAGADIILIDQLQYVEAGDGLNIGAHNRTGVYWEVLNRARDLSDEGPIMIAHQFNREARFSQEMPDMQAIKGSSAVEETATLALGMFQNHDDYIENQLEVGVLCSRNYRPQSWVMKVNMDRGCGFQIIGTREHDASSEG